MNNNNQLFGDIQPSACLLRAATAISKQSEHCHTFDIPQKAAPVKADLLVMVVAQWCFVSLLIKLLIGSKNFALSLCVSMWSAFANPVTHLELINISMYLIKTNNSLLHYA